MRTWKVTYHDGTSEMFMADTYHPSLGTFKVGGSPVSYVNGHLVRSVRVLHEDGDKQAETPEAREWMRSIGHYGDAG